MFGCSFRALNIALQLAFFLVTLLVCGLPLLEEPQKAEEETNIWKTSQQQAGKGELTNRVEDFF